MDCNRPCHLRHVLDNVLRMSRFCPSMQYHNKKVEWARYGTRTKGGQRRDLWVSWNCPSFVQLQGYQVVNQKNALSTFCPAFVPWLLAKSKRDILAKRGQKWDKKDKNWTRGGQKQEFCEHNVVTNRTRTKWGQSRGKKWTEGGQILDKRQKVDKKWDTYKVNQYHSFWTYVVLCYIYVQSLE